MNTPGGDWCVSALSNINFLFSTFLVIIITKVGYELLHILAFYSAIRLSALKYVLKSWNELQEEKKRKSKNWNEHCAVVSRRIEKVSFHFSSFWSSVNFPESRITNENCKVHLWSLLLVHLPVQSFSPECWTHYFTFSICVVKVHRHLKFDGNCEFYF